MLQDPILTVRDGGQARANSVRARLGLFALCTAYFAIILDAGVLNLAVPTIRQDLHASFASIQWALSGYTLALAALLMGAGAAGDRFGHRRLLGLGITIFGVASAGCAAAPSASVLVIARLVQGVGAATLLPATLALVPHLFRPGPARQRATLVWLGTGGVAMAVAPLVGGGLLAGAGWRAIFLLNIPISVVTLALARAGLPADTRRPVQLNLTTQALGVLIMASVATAAIASGSAGWLSRPVEISIAVGVVSGVLAAIRNRRGPAGLEKVGRSVRTAVASAGIMGFSFYGVLYLLSLHLQDVLHWSALRSGMALLPLTVASTAGPFFYRRLARCSSPAQVLLGGFVSVLLGVLVLIVAGSSAPFWAEIVAMLLVGGASTLCFSALTSILVDAAPPAYLGKLSGWQNTSRQAGAMLATALVGSLVIGAPRSHEIRATALLAVVAGAGVAVAFAEASTSHRPDRPRNGRPGRADDRSVRRRRTGRGS